MDQYGGGFIYKMGSVSAFIGALLFVSLYLHAKGSAKQTQASI